MILTDIVMTLQCYEHDMTWYRGKGYKLICYPKIWYNQVIYFLSSSGGFFPPKCHRSINSSPPEHTVSFIWGVQSGCLWNASARPYTYCGTALRNLKFNGMQIQVCTCLYQSYWTKICEKAKYCELWLQLAGAAGKPVDDKRLPLSWDFRQIPQSH